MFVIFHGGTLGIVVEDLSVFFACNKTEDMCGKTEGGETQTNKRTCVGVGKGANKR